MSSTRRMRLMQDFFVDLLDFDLYIHEEDFLGLMSNLKNLIASKYAKRGQVVILDTSIRRHHHSTIQLQKPNGQRVDSRASSA